MRPSSASVVAKLSTGLLVAAAMMAAIAAGPARADASRDPMRADACAHGYDGGSCVVVMIDHLRRMRFDGPVKTVLVGNPAIADVTMISASEGVISARSIGSTNMIFLGETGDAVGDFQILVREGESQRVVVRRGPTSVAAYQCAPRCERTLSMSDSADKHGELLQTILSENSLNESAASAGVQSQ